MKERGLGTGDKISSFFVLGLSWGFEGAVQKSQVCITSRVQRNSAETEVWIWAPSLYVCPRVVQGSLPGTFALGAGRVMVCASVLTSDGCMSTSQLTTDHRLSMMCHPRVWVPGKHSCLPGICSINSRKCFGRPLAITNHPAAWKGCTPGLL